jgi:hypothetical protein
MSTTPIGLPQPAIGSNNWGIPTNGGWALVDLFLRGLRAIPALNVTGNVTVGGSITAGSFVGLDGTFLTSALFDVANGIPQLNAAGLIPASLLATQGIVLVPYSATPVFNAATGGSFSLTLTGNVTSSAFANGTSGPSLVAFKIIQDGTGGRTFVWPSNVHNAGTVNPGANIKSAQIFALSPDGSLDAAGPIMYS